MIELGRICGALLALAPLLAAATAQAQTPGNVIASADPPGSAPGVRAIELGRDVIESERFAAGPDGPVQLLLRDGSTVTLGAGSALSIDRFVFDQAMRTAHLTMTAGPGRFRFVGGRASKDEPAVVDTPTATIEIRGGINLIDVAAGSFETETIQAFGRDTVAISKSIGERQLLVKNGFAMRIASGQPIATARVEQGRLGALLAALEGPPGAAGTVEPNAEQVRVLAAGNSSRPPASYLAGTVLATDPLNAVTATTNRLVASTAQSIAAGAAIGLVGSTPGGSVIVIASTPVSSASPGSGATFGSVFGTATISNFDRGGGVFTSALPPGFVITGTRFLTGPGLPSGGIFIGQGSIIGVGVFPARR